MSHENLDDEKQGSSKKQVLELHGFIPGKVIGNGTYAKVKLAYSEEFKCSVAVKIISKTRAPREYLQKFLPREVEVIRGLQHENLIRFYQSIETTHRVYLIMQYAENGSLLDLIRKYGYLIEDLSRKYFRQLVNVTDYCHSQGVVHRDIKCENLLLDKNYDLKIIDFGFARKNMRPINNRPVLSETYCGSYAYASPEILKGVPYDPRCSDCWAVGVVLYAMVFGRLPFDGTNYQVLLKVQSKVAFPKDSSNVSIECKTLVQKILAPLKIRISLRYIKKELWYREPVRQTVIEEFLSREGKKTKKSTKEVNVPVNAVKTTSPIPITKSDKNPKPNSAIIAGGSSSQTQIEIPSSPNDNKNTNGDKKVAKNAENPKSTIVQHTDGEANIDYSKLAVLNKTEGIPTITPNDPIDNTPKNLVTPSIKMEISQIVTETTKDNEIINNKEIAVNNTAKDDVLVNSEQKLFKEIAVEDVKLPEEETAKNAVAV